MSEHTHSGRFIRSSRRHPCPICGRVKDSDCSWTQDEEQVFCHHAREDLYLGARVGVWAFAGNTKDGRCAHFVRHREQQRPHRRTIVTSSPKGFSEPKPDQNKANPQRLSITQIELARCVPKPPTPFIEDGSKRVFNDVEHQLVATWDHSKTQYVERWDGPDGKKLYRPHHRNNGVWILGGGEAPWGLYCRTFEELIEGQFVTEFEGEKCSEIAEAAGYIAISQPGHAHSFGQIVDRYRTLVELGCAGILYFADNDKTGDDKAERCSEAAAHVSLDFIVIRAADITPGIKAKGSIDEVDDPADFIARAQQLAVAELNKPQLSKGTFWQEIEAIKTEAKRLCSKNPDGSAVCKPQDRAIELREWSRRHGPYLNPDEIRRLIHEARAQLAGSVEMLTQGMEIDAPEDGCGGRPMKADSNMIERPQVGRPRCWSQ